MLRRKAVSEKLTFNTFVKEGGKAIGDGMDATRKRMNKKSHKKRNYGHAPGESGAGSGVSPASAGGGMSEHYDPIIKEIFGASRSQDKEQSPFNDFGYEEDAEEVEAQDQAAAIFKALYYRKDLSREDIIAQIEQRAGVTNSTAISYYQRLAKQAGPRERGGQEDPMGAAQMGGGQEMQGDNVEELPDEDMEGNPEDEEAVIRTVDGAHLVKKEQGEDGKFEEIWIYNIGKNMKDALKIRRDILAGTDIGEKKTTSEDGEQSYTLWTSGNAQILHIKGLAN
jgi:hypothetical protein